MKALEIHNQLTLYTTHQFGRDIVGHIAAQISSIERRVEYIVGQVDVDHLVRVLFIVRDDLGLEGWLVSVLQIIHGPSLGKLNKVFRVRREANQAIVEVKL